MNRRQFAFWLGFGMFSLSEKLRMGGLDRLAAATMRATESKKTPAKNVAKAVHWAAADNKEWRWYERESYINGQWIATGTTTPINKTTGRRKWEPGGYLDEQLLPPEIREADDRYIAAFNTASPSDDHDHDHEHNDPNPQLPTDKVRGRHGRPPSEWLRSLHAYELRTWLKTIEVPEAGVSGMTVWAHLTRDHLFDAAKIVGLSEADQLKLHAAAHFGY